MAKGSSKATAAKSKPQQPKSKKVGTGAEDRSGDSKQATNTIPLESQQKCLNIFRDTFHPGEDDAKVLQEVKGHLYNRDFASAFGKEEHLRVYASRWSPSRALGYLQVLTDIQDNILDLPTDQEQKMLKAISLGGGAGAEVVALAGWMHQIRGQGGNSKIDTIESKFLDIAAWDKVVEDLTRAVTMPPEISKYASAAAKEANVAMVAGDAFRAGFEQVDALAIQEAGYLELFGNVDLITLMFTLNELYSTSMPKTQQMLSNITKNTKPGAHLLVVDSPGSYSTISLSGADKKYPMQWLLDYTLIGTEQSRAKGEEAKWEKVISDDSRWFRLPAEGLKYPIELENMRYQIHLYRRPADSGPG